MVSFVVFTTQYANTPTKTPPLGPLNDFLSTNNFISLVNNFRFLTFFFALQFVFGSLLSRENTFKVNNVC